MDAVAWQAGHEREFFGASFLQCAVGVTVLSSTISALTGGPT
jgi:hypothetical protein